MSAIRCERCGKSRKSADVALNHHGDEHDAGEVLECIDCMTGVDLARHREEHHND